MQKQLKLFEPEGKSKRKRGRPSKSGQRNSKKSRDSESLEGSAISRSLRRSVRSNQQGEEIEGKFSIDDAAKDPKADMQDSDVEIVPQEQPQAVSENGQMNIRMTNVDCVII